MGAHWLKYRTTANPPSGELKLLRCRSSALPGSGVVPAGLLYLSPQDADIIGHHVVERLQLLLDPFQLHGLRLGLFGPGRTAAFKMEVLPALLCLNFLYSLLSDSFGQQSFFTLVLLFHQLLLLLQLLQTSLFPPERTCNKELN